MHQTFLFKKQEAGNELIDYWIFRIFADTFSVHQFIVAVPIKRRQNANEPSLDRVLCPSPAEKHLCAQSVSVRQEFCLGRQTGVRPVARVG